MDTWDGQRGQTTVADVLFSILAWLPDADGVTVSGGEPFDQPEALFDLLAALRQVYSGDVLVYSGHALEDLNLTPFKGLIDALIADPFRRDLTQTLALRGSDNQRLVYLSPLGKTRFAPYAWPVASDEARSLDVMFDDQSGEVFLAGIPRRGDMRRLSELLESLGHLVVTTEDRRGES